ncbi:HEAT repeat domain-containing protein [Niallia sp. 03133]|uniref:HEAT repeat domain-containing protein n=1 Tax=Niallia sp. 03133 TaxID=3458060 RepID=UPI00404425B4
MTILMKLSSQIGEKTEEGNRKAAQECLENPSLLTIIGEGLASKNAALAGDCAEVLTMTAEKQPKLLLPFSDLLIELLSHKKTKVRWEAMHAIALIAGYIPSKITPLLPKLQDLIHTDKSTIVRDYAIETLCNYAKAGEMEGQEAFLYLKESLHVWNGKHRARVLKGFLYICQSTDIHTIEIRGVAEEYKDDTKGVVKKAVKELIKAIDSEKGK